MSQRMDILESTQMSMPQSTVLRTSENFSGEGICSFPPFVPNSSTEEFFGLVTDREILFLIAWLRGEEQYPSRIYHAMQYASL